uniref:Uncharacterized protein n=1 Tax=Opuntia streptacantha TaxID=393608 RepID=A0A7C9AGX8_OPUST
MINLNRHLNKPLIFLMQSDSSLYYFIGKHPSSPKQGMTCQLQCKARLNSNGDPISGELDGKLKLNRSQGAAPPREPPQPGEEQRGAAWSHCRFSLLPLHEV